MNELDFIEKQLQESEALFATLRNELGAAIQQGAGMIIDALRRGKKILICGNGGSAADAQHFAAELVGRLQRDRTPLPAIALTTDTSILTAVGNDYGFDKIFRRQVEAWGEAGDLLLAISTSGNSPNILEAIAAARQLGLQVLTLAGRDGGAMSACADLALVVPARTSQHIQEGHIGIIHIWCALVEDTLFPPAS
ncbi:MAG TPA: D-sedoheptulose 7-phosphate isomerase [bacterium]|mgnify:CR=1 FL=1|nr:D-sedoheptulose 7-phosphate isomerase [bacterium]HQG44371.1 D-sedoheptulose 7-phosphate isomerase [bacterium]HQI47321.1 D-sedoheptulose 7-phosphate isomerase [bacterium]HQJ63404.1 D-sedoheptulose 7-phosphate isomerase [bacterium]